MGQEIEVTIGWAWGCEHTSEEGLGFADYVSEELAEALPEVMVMVDYGSIRNDIRINDECTVTEQEVRDLIDRAWNNWCAEGWDIFLQATGSEARGAKARL